MNEANGNVKMVWFLGTLLTLAGILFGVFTGFSGSVKAQTDVLSEEIRSVETHTSDNTTRIAVLESQFSTITRQNMELQAKVDALIVEQGTQNRLLKDTNTVLQVISQILRKY